MKKAMLGIVAIALIVLAVPQTSDLAIPNGSDRVKTVDQAF
ncbi:hypothetical protein [Halalkalibacter krulwichiae]|uniref:Uncharacterized protein n=1 Tax=Halalkalibacter krulwichiae TaxID=199441 RepID=A0A1X9MDW5_9BACI|nr:hypothetical protein [Halalkalibacter krulwichiae]ARK30740.1 hypothetical protein BkAM31D_13365 [Halalkalibacter krulwichiae]